MVRFGFAMGSVSAGGQRRSITRGGGRERAGAWAHAAAAVRLTSTVCLSGRSDTSSVAKKSASSPLASPTSLLSARVPTRMPCSSSPMPAEICGAIVRVGVSAGVAQVTVGEGHGTNHIDAAPPPRHARGVAPSTPKTGRHWRRRLARCSRHRRGAAPQSQSRRTPHPRP